MLLKNEKERGINVLKIKTEARENFSNILYSFIKCEQYG